MSASPTTPASGSDPAPDVFERLLRSRALLIAQELAEIINLSPKVLYSYAGREMIPHFRIETNVRFRGKEVADWLGQKQPRSNQHPVCRR